MRSMFFATAIAFVSGVIIPAAAAPLAPGAIKAPAAAITQVKSKKKKKAMRSSAKRQTGNDTMNSSSGTATQDGGRGGGMTGTPDRTGSGTQ